jgi:hypothetical protein
MIATALPRDMDDLPLVLTISGAHSCDLHLVSALGKMQIDVICVIVGIWENATFSNHF